MACLSAEFSIATWKQTTHMPFNQEVFEIVVPDIGWGQLEQGNELGFLLIPFLDQFLDLLDKSAQRC